MTELIGRTSEIAAVERWLESNGRLLTIVGPPGVGKTRIAHAVATRNTAAVICDLTACRTAADVERALQRALGNASGARLARALASVGAPIVLDRFEHLVETARALVAGWIEKPGVRLVITSREPLGLAFETTLSVGPLAEADAVALYAARARRKIDEDVAAAIVRALDRLPLAIELAAARAAVLSDQDVLARLERGIGAIDSPSSTLRSAIGWSMEHLAPEERATLLQCAIFRGAFDARAAEAVVRHDGPSSDTVACLVALERKSLARRVAPEQADARIALYDAVRDVALDALVRGGAHDDTAVRHAAHYRRLAEDAVDRGDPAALGALASEAEDAAAAQAFVRDSDPLAAAKLAVALDLAFAGHAPTSDHLELLSSAVDAAKRANDPACTAKALHARARAHRVLGAARRAQRDLREALSLARAAGASRVEADVLRMLGVVARQLSRPARAHTLLEHALAIHERNGYARGAATVLDDLGVVAHDGGDRELARESYERALALERIAGDRRFEGITLAHLGLVAHDLGDLAGAVALHREALARHRETDDRRFEGFTLAFLAAAMLEHRDLEGARSSLDAAAAIDARLGDVDSGALLAAIRCATAAAADQIALAKELFERAARELAARDDPAQRRTLDLFAVAIAVAEARRARSEGRREDEHAHLDAARASLESGSPPSCIEQRLADRIVRGMLERECATSGLATVAADGTWFDCGGRRVALATRKSLVGLLAKLAHEHRVAPGRRVTIDALFEAGWPGERVQAASARRRVYVAIDTLRSLGLRTAIVQRDGGYVLDRTVQVVEEAGLNGL